MKRSLIIFAFVFAVATAANAQRLLWQYLVPIPTGTYTSTWQGGNGFADSGTGRSAWVVYRTGTNGQLAYTQVVWLDSNGKLIKETDFAGSMNAQIIRLTPSALYLWLTWGVQNTAQIMRISPGKQPNSTVNITDDEEPASFSPNLADPSGFFTVGIGGNGFIINRYSN